MNKACPLTILGRLVSLGEVFFWRFWWVCLLNLICFSILEQGLKSVWLERERLYHQQMILQQEKEKAIALQGSLTLQIASQNDPAFVELVLKKGLGLVPEGQIKILFTD